MKIHDVVLSWSFRFWGSSEVSPEDEIEVWVEFYFVARVDCIPRDKLSWRNEEERIQHLLFEYVPKNTDGKFLNRASSVRDARHIKIRPRIAMEGLIYFEYSPWRNNNSNFVPTWRVKLAENLVIPRACVRSARRISNVLVEKTCNNVGKEQKGV